MGVLGDALEWFFDPVRWSGEFGIPARLLEHLELSAFSLAAAALIALPLGVYIGHARRFEFVTISVANLGRAVPSFGILALALPVTIELGLGLGFWPAFIALWFLAIPPMLTNAHIAIKGVDADMVEAARGMGMSEREILSRTELPLGLPLIIGGVRTSAVQVVATATLAALVAGGGLGRFIIDGFAVRDNAQIFGGAVLVAGLAIVVDLALGVLERIARKRAGLAPTGRKEAFQEVGQVPRPAGSVM
ncbi:MAG: ABC transporter permease [Actinomycetota bacterium]